ncbi:MAG: response regulator [Desulfobacteraceae bacterium]|nr:response regulator [Desulfobacteraceae bacterium]
MTKILIVDDEEDIRLLLEQILEQKGYACVLAADAAEARDCLKEHDCDLVLCDINMPGESGLDLIRDVSAKYRDVAVVMVTGIDDPVVAETVFEVGVFDYVAKPIRRNRILMSVANALRRRELEIANRAYSEGLEQLVADRTSQLKKALDGIIQAIASTVEIKDLYTAGHQLRVAGLAFAIAKEMGLSEDQAEGVRVAGTIHDLGKIAVPAEILSKPGQITEIEFGIIKTHPQTGYDILKDMEFPWPLAQIVLQHHEKMDGSGYPQGLSDEKILLEARVLSVADVVEAMASHRPYRPALGIDVALEEISKNKGLLYDPEVVDACLKLFMEKGFKFE